MAAWGIPAQALLDEEWAIISVVITAPAATRPYDRTANKIPRASSGGVSTQYQAPA